MGVVYWLATPPSDPPVVYVSMTTIPSRVNDALAARIRALDLSKVTMFWLHVPYVCARTGEPYPPIPDSITAIPKLVVHRMEKDWGPGTKVMGAIDMLATQIPCPSLDHEMIVTLDDDIGYHPSVITRLVQARQQRSPHDLMVVANTYRPLHHRGGDLLSMNNGMIMEGWNGILYDRGIFHASHMAYLKKALDHPLCRLHDDVVLTYLFRDVIVPAGNSIRADTRFSSADPMGLINVTNRRSMDFSSYEVCAFTMATEIKPLLQKRDAIHKDT